MNGLFIFEFLLQNWLKLIPKVVDVMRNHGLDRVLSHRKLYIIVLAISPFQK